MCYTCTILCFAKTGIPKESKLISKLFFQIGTDLSELRKDVFKIKIIQFHLDNVFFLSHNE